MLNFSLIAVELFILFIAFFILALDLFFPRAKKFFLSISLVSLLGSVFYLVANFFLEEQGFYGFIESNPFHNSIKILLIIASLICLVLSPKILKQDKIYSAEFFFFFLIVLVSMLLLLNSQHLFFIYICLETASITSFILCSLNKNNLRSIEGGMKYFLLNAFSSAILLYGISLIFASSGSFALEQIYLQLANQTSVSLTTTLGILLLVTGFGFKISLVPFHMWAPDVYSSAPLSITAFFSTPLKIAFIVIFTKICMVALIPYLKFLQVLLGLLFIITLLVSNLLALVQKEVKRIIAYSSISHAGFLLLAALNIPTQGITSFYFYIIAYIFSSLGVFACLIYLMGNKEIILLDDLQGQANKHPVVCGIFCFFLFSLAGLPLSAGFIAKLTLFYDALKSGYFGLVMVGLIASAISAGYYLKIGAKFFAKETINKQSLSSSSFAIQSILILCIFVLLALGIYPSLLDWNISFLQGVLPLPFTYF